MKKKITFLTLCAMLLALSSSAEAQQTGKVFRIGFLDSSTASGSAVLVDAFRQELGNLGWIEGKNISIEYRFAEQKSDRAPELAAELVRLRVDLIVVTAGPSGLAVELNTKRLEMLKGRSPQARPSRTSAAAGRQHNIRPPTERAQGCGSVTEAKIGGNRD